MVADHIGIEQFVFPFADSRAMQGLLVQEGFTVGRLHVATLMRRLGIKGHRRKPNIWKPVPGHRIYPYMLRKLPITRPKQVWVTDITHISMARRIIYPAAVLDWFTRRVFGSPVSIRREADFRIETVEAALTRHGKPEIFNPDQGSQFTSTDFIMVLAARGIKISMDGKGPGETTVFVERLWRTTRHTKRSTCAPMAAPRKPAPGSDATSACATAAAHMHRLTGGNPDQAHFNLPMLQAVAA